MAVSKEKCKSIFTPRSTRAVSVKNPDTYNEMTPSWCFRSCDKQVWTFTASEFINDILSKLKEWETQTWNEILVKAKKQNHSIDTQNLNEIARNRLEELRLEADAIISMRLQATHRLYGYRIGSVFYILWYDTDHGDNETCVCKSRKK